MSVAVDEDSQRRRIDAALRADGLSVVSADAPSGDGRNGSPQAVVLTGEGSAATQSAAVRAARERLRGAPVVIVSRTDRDDGARRSLAAGAEGVVLESELETALGPAVRAVSAGQVSLPLSLRPHVGQPVFSSREKQVLGMVVLGFPNAEVADRLYLAESTVKSHLRSAFRKLGVRSRAEAAALILDSKRGLGTGILSISDGDAES